MSKEIRLIFVSHDNHNKYYTMKEDPGGDTFASTWGRVDVTSDSKVYPMSKWDSTYRAKIRKGYVDQTELFIEEEVVDEGTPVIIIQHPVVEVNTFVNKLQGFANSSIRSNYTVSSEKVTQRQIDKAQEILNSIQTKIPSASTYGGYVDVESVNKLFLELYSVIPRRMGKVYDYLLEELNTDDGIRSANNRLATEQSNIDVMAGQVSIRDTRPIVSNGVKIVENEVLK